MSLERGTGAGNQWTKWKTLKNLHGITFSWWLPTHTNNCFSDQPSMEAASTASLVIPNQSHLKASFFQTFGKLMVLSDFYHFYVKGCTEFKLFKTHLFNHRCRFKDLLAWNIISAFLLVFSPHSPTHSMPARITFSHTVEHRTCYTLIFKYRDNV